MHHLKLMFGVVAMVANLHANVTVAAEVTRDDISAWLTESVLVDPPVGGTIVRFDELNSLKPWIAPGFYEEFEFPEVRTFGERQGYVWGGGPDGNRWRFGPDGDFDLDMADRMDVVRDRLGVIGDQLADAQIMAPGVFTYGFGVTSVEGVEFIDLNPELGEYFGSDSGVLVVEVDEESTLGLMAGDVVLAVGAREADTVGRVLRLIRSYDEDEPIQFRVIRRGSELTAEGFLQ